MMHSPGVFGKGGDRGSGGLSVSTLSTSVSVKRAYCTGAYANNTSLSSVFPALLKPQSQHQALLFIKAAWADTETGRLCVIAISTS